MKKTLFAVALFLIAHTIAAQTEVKNITEGTVYFREVIKLDIKLEGDAAQFANAFPKEQKSKKLLHFNTSASLYKKDDAGETNEMIENETGGMVIKMQQPDQEVYTDIVNNKQLERREFMTREFLIEREVGKKKWKFTGNCKTILGYACQEAVIEKDDKTIKVWFAPEIPIAVGPSKFIGLPGLILAVDVNDGEIIFEATKIDAKNIDKTLLKKPAKGKKVTDEEFKKIVDEKMKEMGIEGGEGGGHRVMIKISN